MANSGSKDQFIPFGTDIDGYRKALMDWDRLFGSDLYFSASLEELGACFVLWGKSYRQTPPGSLPKGDKILAKMLGIDADEWAKLKTVALYGWVECSDGRLYHRVIADDVLRLAALKISSKKRTEAARVASVESKRRTRLNGHHHEDEDFPL